jgi:metal-responsive CopG/Arc/MetJ family transcriptional regulator
MGYQSGSKATYDAARLFVSEQKWLKEEDTVQTGIILIVYDLEAGGLNSELN